MRLKKTIMGLILGVFIFGFLASVSMAVVEQDKLTKLINYCVEKGYLLKDEEYPMLYLEKIEKVSEDTEKRLYLSFHYVIWQNEIYVHKIDCIDEEWTAIKGGVEIAYDFDKDQYARYKDEDKYIIKQKIIVDGGQSGRPDGLADRNYERIIVETAEGMVLYMKDSPEPSEKDMQKKYESHVEKMLELVK